MAAAVRAAAEDTLWQDRLVRFDVHPRLLELRKGEVAIDSLNSVEDTKGSTGERGKLTVTNLRIIWQSHKNAKANMTVGLGSIQSLSIKAAQSRSRGPTQALCIITRNSQGSRLEFIFTSIVRASPRIFTTCQAVYRAYESSRLYRDLKLRGALIKDKELLQLPLERIYNKISGVWNLASDQGNLGTLFVTNVRIVWHAALAENFNVSIPYMQMASMRVRESKFGPCLVVETSEQSGGYLLGFKIDPKETLVSTAKEIGAFFSTAHASPEFGVQHAVEEAPEGEEVAAAARVPDDVTIDDSEEAASDALAAYFAEGGGREAERQLELHPGLGLAIEVPPEGVSVEKL